jgi:hypothetical protein
VRPVLNIEAVLISLLSGLLGDPEMCRMQSEFLSDLRPAHAGFLHSTDILRPHARNMGKSLRHVLISLAVTDAGPFPGLDIVLGFCPFHCHGRFLDSVVSRFQLGDGRHITLSLGNGPDKKHDGQTEKNWCEAV